MNPLSAIEPDLLRKRAPPKERVPAVQIKRIYEPRQRGDGLRILVDRLWPRGISKVQAHLYRWAKELAPSTELRVWFNHDPKKWQQFCRRYKKELSERTVELNALKRLARRRNITLLYAARNREQNEAVVLRKALEST